MTSLGCRVAQDAVASSQSAFVRGFIDDGAGYVDSGILDVVSIRVRARLHR